MKQIKLKDSVIKIKVCIECPFIRTGLYKEKYCHVDLKTLHLEGVRFDYTEAIHDNCLLEDVK